MRYCTRCIAPETMDTIMFDEEGVCSVCRQIDYRDEKIDWEARGRELREFVELYRNQGLYDCVIPFSGGKDSTFQAWYVVNELKLKPLLVTFDHRFYRPLVYKNNERTLKILGVDRVIFTPSWHVVREVMLESLKRRGDFCWHCHTGIFGHTMQVAVRYRIPLVIWGETIAEYDSWYSYAERQEMDEKSFNRTQNLGITADDMYEFLKGRVSKRDLYPFRFPSRKEVRELNMRSICLGNYIKWDTKKQAALIKDKLGWKGQPVEGSPPEFDYEKIECMFQGVRDYCKYIKRGYGRAAHLACVDIRNKRMTREEGWEYFKRYDGKRPESLDLFLDFLQITEDEFLGIMMKHMVSPWVFDPKGVQRDKRLPDMDVWDKTMVNELSVGERDKDGRLILYT